MVQMMQPDAGQREATIAAVASRSVAGDVAEAMAAEMDSFTAADIVAYVSAGAAVGMRECQCPSQIELRHLRTAVHHMRSRDNDQPRAEDAARDEKVTSNR